MCRSMTCTRAAARMNAMRKRDGMGSRRFPLSPWMASCSTVAVDRLSPCPPWRPPELDNPDHGVIHGTAERTAQIPFSLDGTHRIGRGPLMLHSGLCRATRHAGSWSPDRLAGLGSDSGPRHLARDLAVWSCGNEARASGLLRVAKNRIDFRGPTVGRDRPVPKA
jgi:hypothetical protein